MNVNDVMRLLDAKLICGEENLETEVHEACGSDMICIVFVRGKEPDEDMIALAQRRGMVLLSTAHRMFTACGLLWEGGLRGGKTDECASLDI